MRPLLILISLLLVSIDAAGQNWVRTAGPVEDEVFDLCLDSNGILYAVTPLGVNRSTNGGAHWTRPFLFPTPTNISRIVVAPNGNIIASSDSGIFLSTNGAATFTKRLVPGDPGFNFVTQFAITGTGRIYASSFQGLFYSDNNGLHWKQHEGFTDEMLMGVVASHDLVLVNSEFGVHCSFNNGETWGQFSDLPGFVIKLLILPNDLWVAVDDLGMLWRYNAEHNWVPLESHADIYTAEVLRDGSMLASAQSGIYHIKDTSTWIDVTAGFEANQFKQYYPVSRFVEDPKTGIYYAATFSVGVWKSAAVLKDVVPEAETMSLKVSQNPFTDRTTVRFHTEEPSWSRIELRNLLGTVVWKSSREYLVAGMNSIPINVPGISPGNYLLVLQTNERTVSKWVTIVK